MSRPQRAERERCRWFVVAILGLALGSGTAWAQSVSVQAAAGQYYLGDPMRIQITADGFEEDPAPTIDVPQVDRGRLVYLGVAPSVSSSIVIVAGQIRRSKEVQFVFSYELQTDEPGAVSVGPFVVTQGTTRRATSPVRIEFLDVPASDLVGVELELPDAPVFLGERVPITLRFRLLGGVRKNLYRYTLRVPLFDLTDSFRFLDPPDPGATDIKIQTSSGELNLKADAQESTVDGEQALVVSIRRIMVPLRDGPVSIPPTVLDVDEGTRFRRDLFGERQATHVRKWRAADRQRRFVVKRIPTDRTPPSFAGAVGTGFSLRVSADRTVVQIGEPIALNLELRGDGNLETASLPPLDAEGLLPSAGFRVPEGELAGLVSDGAKQFHAVVRVVDRNVTEIPALEYSWFDPATETFHSTQSRPIALIVRDAQVIGAAQVEREPSFGSEAPRAPGAESSARSGTTPAIPPGARVPIGADLAIERDAVRLTRVVTEGSGGPWGVAGLYLGTVMLVGVAWLDRRRRDVDPKVAARRRRMSEQLDLVRASKALPAAEAAGALASALRSLVKEAPETSSAEIDAFVGECDARSYAPEPMRSASPLDSDLRERAQRLAERIVESVT